MTRTERIHRGTTAGNGGGTTAYRLLIWCFLLIGSMVAVPGAALSVDARLSPKQLWDKGNEFASNKLYIDAIEYYTLAIKKNKGEIPVNEVARIFNSRGLAHGFRNDDEKALTDFSNAIELDDKNTEFFLNRSAIYLKQKQYGQARSDLSAAIALNPRNVAAYAGRAKVYQEGGDHDRAVADLVKLLEIEPGNVRALYSMGLSLKAKQQYDLALDAFGKVLKMDQNNAAASYQKAAIYSRMKRIDAACTWLDIAVGDGFRDWSALKNDPDFDTIRKNSCYLKVVAGK